MPSASASKRMRTPEACQVGDLALEQLQVPFHFSHGAATNLQIGNSVETEGTSYGAVGTKMSTPSPQTGPVATAYLRLRSSPS
jgi:hypothetical protein